MALALGATVARADDAGVAADLVQHFCVTCHGKEGRSENPTFPRLAGQLDEYLEAQINAFHDHTRADPHAQAYMWGIASKPELTHGVIEEISKYYAQQKPVPGEPAADAALAAKGKALFANGDKKREIPECAECHGKNAEGQGPYARLAGQYPDYLARQLRAFRENTRENPIMHPNALNLTDEEIDALAVYLGSL
ncbi:MAG: c-type cytochrome [Alphaproteobacteria bacterium]